MMNAPINFSMLIQMGVVIMGFWGFYKVVKEILAAITARHDKEQKWDEVVKNVQEERDKIYERYDEKLAEMNEKINGNYSDTEAKLQEVKAELYILTDCMAAVLDGLHQQGCNGKVTKASEELDEYLNGRAHK